MVLETTIIRQSSVDIYWVNIYLFLTSLEDDLNNESVKWSWQVESEKMF